MFSNSNYDGCIPTQFIVTTKSTEHLIKKDCTSISEYYSNACIDFDDLKSKIDQEFVAHILISKPFAEKGYTDQLDLGLDDALVYAYIFTHIDPEQHGFLKDSLQPHKISETLKLTENKEVYLPMIIHKEKTSKENEYSHISFTTVIQEESNFTVKSFDTLGQNSSNEQYIKSQQTGTQTKQKSKKQTSKKQTKEQQPQIILKSQITIPEQGASGCGFLTALNAVSYINDGTAVCPSIAGKSIEETKKTLIEGFGYTIEVSKKEFETYDKIDGTKCKEAIYNIYESDNGIKTREKLVFKISPSMIYEIQQENKEGTQHGTPPIEHKTITTSFSSFASIGTSSTNDINYNHQPYQSTPQKGNMFSQSL